MASIFTKIIHGEIPCYKILENKYFIAFLDIHPLQKGHTLVVPKIEIDKFYDVDEIHLREWMPFASKVAKSIEKGIVCQRVGVSFVGLDVPHAHMHLIPIHSSTQDISCVHIKPLELSQEEFLYIQQKIVENF
ncbi:MAG: HIT family protein [Chitinophagaceae bacterium]